MSHINKYIIAIESTMYTNQQESDQSFKGEQCEPVG